jgi:hypothetical protein
MKATVAEAAASKRSEGEKDIPTALSRLAGGAVIGFLDADVAAQAYRVRKRVLALEAAGGKGSLFRRVGVGVTLLRVFHRYRTSVVPFRADATEAVALRALLDKGLRVPPPSQMRNDEACYGPMFMPLAQQDGKNFGLVIVENAKNWLDPSDDDRRSFAAMTGIDGLDAALGTMTPSWTRLRRLAHEFAHAGQKKAWRLLDPDAVDNEKEALLLECHADCRAAQTILALGAPLETVAAFIDARAVALVMQGSARHATHFALARVFARQIPSLRTYGSLPPARLWDAQQKLVRTIVEQASSLLDVESPPSEKTKPIYRLYGPSMMAAAAWCLAHGKIADPDVQRLVRFTLEAEARLLTRRDAAQLKATAAQRVKRWMKRTVPGAILGLPR